MMPASLPVVLRRNLRRALAARDLERAREVLDLLKEEDPVSRQTRGLELDFLIRSDRLSEAQALAGDLVELYPDSPGIRFLAGQLAYKKKDYPAALEHLRESFGLHAHWRSQHLLARTLTQAGHFPEAERLLLDLADEHPHCRRDLAWLYERMGEAERALRELEVYLKRYPGDRLARSQRLRLSARRLDAGALLEEVEGLLAVDEEVPPALVPEYCEALLKLGRQDELRSFLETLRDDLDPRLALRVAWTCYRLRVYDLALELFIRAFPVERHNFKFLTALETAAERCQRIDVLYPLYEAHAAEEKSLYGRLKTLKRRAGGARADTRR